MNEVSKKLQEILNTKFAEMNRAVADELGCEVRDLNAKFTIRHAKTGEGFGAKAIAH